MQDGGETEVMALLKHEISEDFPRSARPWLAIPLGAELAIRPSSCSSSLLALCLGRKAVVPIQGAERRRIAAQTGSAAEGERVGDREVRAQ